MAFPLLGALVGGLASGFASSGFNALAQSNALENSKELSAFGAQQQLDVLARSGAAQNVANKALGRSSAFANYGANVPPSSSVNQSALPSSMGGFDGLISALADLNVKKQDVKTGQAQEKFLNEQAKTEAVKRENMEAETNKLKIDADVQAKFLERYDEVTNAQIRKLNSESESIDKTLDISYQKLPYELKHLAAVAYNLNSQGELSQAQVKQVAHQIQLIDEQTKNAKKEWDKLDAETQKVFADKGVSEQEQQNLLKQGEILEFQKRMNAAHGAVNAQNEASKKYYDAMLARWRAYVPVLGMFGGVP